MTDNEIAVLNVLKHHRGKASAISYQRLAVAVGLSPRQARRIVQGLIRSHRVGISTSYSPSCGGYYLPKSAREVSEAGRKLRHHGISILARAAALEKITLAELLGQLRLEM